jgi:hypothetical protein
METVGIFTSIHQTVLMDTADTLDNGDFVDNLNQYHQPDLHPALMVPSDDQIQQIELEIAGVAQRRATDLANIVREISNKAPISYSASYLKNSNEEGSEEDAMKMVTGGIAKINVNSFMMQDEDNICWDPLAHYLDSICAVSTNPGLSAVLPNVPHNVDFAFTLKPKEWARPYKCKFGQIGFDIKQCALYLGYESHRQVWILFRPRGDRITPYPAGIASGDTQLGKQYALMYWVFIWSNLKEMGVGAECGDEAYIDVLDVDALRAHGNMR